MFFPDYTLYEYKIGYALKNVFAVGWIDSLHPYNVGAVDSEIVDRLWDIIFCTTPSFNVHVNTVRGIHPCNFCDNDIYVHLAGDGDAPIGISEIWIPYKDKWFASPSMIVHYIESHGYNPGEEYLDAITQLDLNSTVISQDAFNQATPASVR